MVTIIVAYRHEYIRPSRNHRCQSREYLKKNTFTPSCTGAQSAFNFLHTEFNLLDHLRIPPQKKYLERNWSHFSVKRHAVRSTFVVISLVKVNWM